MRWGEVVVVVHIGGEEDYIPEFGGETGRREITWKM